MSDQEKSFGHAEMNLDLNLMKDLAHAAAEVAAERIGTQVREEMRQENAELRAELLKVVRDEIQKYHGDMTPTEHAVQHERIDRFLNWMDNVSKNFWGQLAAGLMKWMIGIFLLGYFVWTQGSGLMKSTGAGAG